MQAFQTSWHPNVGPTCSSPAPDIISYFVHIRSNTLLLSIAIHLLMLSVPHLLFIHFISKEWDCLFNLCTQRIHRIRWLSLSHKHHMKNNDLLTEGVYFTSKPVKLRTEHSKPFSTKLEPGGNVRLVLAPIQIQFNLWTIQEPACFSIATASSRATSLCHNCKCLRSPNYSNGRRRKKCVNSTITRCPNILISGSFTIGIPLSVHSQICILCCGETAHG